MIWRVKGNDSQTHIDCRNRRDGDTITMMQLNDNGDNRWRRAGVKAAKRRSGDCRVKEEKAMRNIAKGELKSKERREGEVVRVARLRRQ